MSASAATSLAITNPLVKYRALVVTKAIMPDPAQHRLAIHLAKLYGRLKDYEPELEYSHQLNQISRAVNSQRTHVPQQGGNEQPPPTRSSWRDFWTAKHHARDSLALTRKFTSHESALQMTSPRGLMLHGEVGTGKSMLIDLFADCLPNRKKHRSHFNTFMLDTFARLEALRAERSHAAVSRIPSPLATHHDDYSLLWLAKEMVQTSPILFLDEFQMPDRVASKILTNLMTAFFQLGGVLIATSNRMPEELAKAAGIGLVPAPRQRSFGWRWRLGRKAPGQARYSRGYNEFAAFLEVLKARCEVWEMEGMRDFRRLGSGSEVPTKSIDLDTDFRCDLMTELSTADGLDQPMASGVAVQMPKHFHIAADSSQSEVAEQWAIARALDDQLPESTPWSPANMKVYGRVVDIPRAYKNVTMWKFEELCKATLGPADYISLASLYDTIILTGVPILTWMMKNEARRFITLLDALYECRCKLFISAAAGPDDIFFPEEQQKKSQSGRNEEGSSGDSVYSETLSEVYQDAFAPFRPNILTQNPNYAEPEDEPDYTHARLAGLLQADTAAADALEKGDPVSRGALGGSSNNNNNNNPFGRSFGRADATLERKPIDPDEERRFSPSSSSSSTRPDFQKTSAFTGEDERFAYKRAQSRLWEMCSAQWWARHEPGWHRPTPTRRWEEAGDDAKRNAAAAASQASLVHVPVPTTEIRMGAVVEDDSADVDQLKRFRVLRREG